MEEIVFLVSAAALGKGKGLTVSLLASGDSGGDGAQEIGKTTFTDSVGTAPQLAVVTYKVSALNGRYVAVKLRHDAAAEVVCGVTAASSGTSTCGRPRSPARLSMTTRPSGACSPSSS